MTNKRIRLPREGLVEPEQQVPPGDRLISETDVEGHGWAHPAPPVDFSKGTTSHGGELAPNDDTAGPDH